MLYKASAAVQGHNWFSQNSFSITSCYCNPTLRKYVTNRSTFWSGFFLHYIHPFFHFDVTLTKKASWNPPYDTILFPDHFSTTHGNPTGNILYRGLYDARKILAQTRILDWLVFQCVPAICEKAQLEFSLRCELLHSRLPRWAPKEVLRAWMELRRAF